MCVVEIDGLGQSLLRNLLATTFLLAVFAAAMCVPAHSQTKAQKKEQKVFAAVPQHLRARLVERLNMYVEYERTRQYDKLYDLLSEYVVHPGSLSRAAYVIASKKTIDEGYRTVLLKFKPTATIDLSADDQGILLYDIWGAATVNDKGKIYDKNAAIEARWINGEWYFSGVASVIID
jgi:hypothetical protein